MIIILHFQLCQRRWGNRGRVSLCAWKTLQDCLRHWRSFLSHRCQWTIFHLLQFSDTSVFDLDAQVLYQWCGWLCREESWISFRFPTPITCGEAVNHLKELRSLDRSRCYCSCNRWNFSCSPVKPVINTYLWTPNSLEKVLLKFGFL